MSTYIEHRVVEPAVNCAYYNSTTKPIILDIYEGIPQNLILNLLGWLILLVLFSVLRKKASNYGRLALMQNSVHTEKWTELFYQPPQEFYVVERGGDRASISSNTSLNDIGGGWILAIFKISRQDFLNRCGSDALHYLSFQKHLIFYMFIMMIISICIILPVNFQGSLQGDETNFGHTTLSNLSPDSSWLWVHLIVALLYLPFGLLLMRSFSVRAHIKENYAKRNPTLMIFNINRSVCNKEDIETHFKEAYPHLTIREIQLAYDVTLLVNLEKDRVQASQAKIYCEDYLRRKRKRLLLKPKTCGRFCPCSATVDALDYYVNEEDKLTRAVEVARADSLRRPVGVIFVTFETVEAAREVLHDLQPPAGSSCFGGCTHTVSTSRLQTRLQPETWRAQYASLRSNIIWENLSIPPSNWCTRAILINLLLFILLFFLTTPAYVLNMLTTVNFTEKLYEISPVVSQFLPTLIMWTATALLPNLVCWSDRFLGHWTKTEQNHAIMRKTYFFLLFMVLILPAVGLTSAQAFVEWAWHWQEGSNRWECLFLPDKGAFFVNYIITSSLIGTGLELLRFSELFFYLVELCMARSRAETSTIRKFILTDFPFGVHYAWMLLIFTMTMMFSLSCPIITAAGFIYMILKHLVDRYNIYFVYRPSRLDAKIHGSAVHSVVFAPIFVQIAFMSLCLLRQGHNTAISVFAIGSTLVTVLSAISISVFNWCADFSPIIYERKKEHTAQMASHSSFIPEILRSEDHSAESDSEPIRDYGTNPQIV